MMSSEQVTRESFKLQPVLLCEPIPRHMHNPDYRVHISDLNSEGLLANVDMGPPVLSLWGWTEGEPRGRLLCSGVLGKGQCTQLRSGGKCKTNMPHTCFPLSCYGSAFKDPPPLNTHSSVPLPRLFPNVHRLNASAPIQRVRGTAARSTQEGFLITTMWRLCSAGLCVRTDGAVRLLVGFMSTVPLHSAHRHAGIR